MRRIAIGNDFRVSWTLTQLGEAFDVVGKTFDIEVLTAYGVIVVNDVVAEGNVLSFNVPASGQIYIGNYDIRLHITDEQTGQKWRLEQCEAFTLVSCGACADSVEVVQLSSGIVYPSNGLSAYQLAVASGEYTGDYEGYQRWLARYAESTAEQANTTAEQANTTANQANTTAEQANTTANQANTTANLAIKYTSQSLTEEQQTQARENIYAMADTPSGDPMHDAYLAAGAVWDASTKTWSANGRTGLSNADILSLYNNSDMDELLFRKLWNTINLADNDSANFGRYNPATGFYELNGIWDLTYQQALDIYANSDSGVSQGVNRGELNLPLTTIRTNDVFFAGISMSRIVDFNKTFSETADDTCLIPNAEKAQGARITHSRYLRRIYPMIYSGYYRNSYLRVITCPSLLHVFFYRPNRNIYVNGAPLISYQSLFTLINYYNGTSGINVYVDADTYSYIAGTADPTILSMSPINNGYTDIIPYMKNHKGKLNDGVSVSNAVWTPDNVYWREENAVKGINGEYIYPSFAEYLTANPDNFATAADWQALATLAEEKGVTITTA